MTKLLAMISTLLITVGSYANNTIVVPDDYPTINQAINAANTNDVVLVRDGTYVGNFIITKSITLKSENGPEFTTLVGDGFSTLSAVGINNHQGEYLVIDGFTVTGGIGRPVQINLINYSFAGGGIHVSQVGRIRIENCIVENNTAQIGGGILIHNANGPILNNVTIQQNSTTLDDFAVNVALCGNPFFNRLTIIDNNSGGIGSNTSPSLSNGSLSNSIIARNAGHGVQATRSSEQNWMEFNLMSCTIVDNAGFGIRNHPLVYDGSYGFFQKTNLIVYNNSLGSISGWDQDIRASIVEGYSRPLERVYSVSPEFADADYTLLPSSPAINTGDFQHFYTRNLYGNSREDGFGGGSIDLRFKDFDLLGNPRLHTRFMDMGAYENQSSLDSDWVFVIPTDYSLEDALKYAVPGSTLILSSGVFDQTYRLARTFHIVGEDQSTVVFTHPEYSIRASGIEDAYFNYREAPPILVVEDKTTLDTLSFAGGNYAAVVFNGVVENCIFDDNHIGIMVTAETEIRNTSFTNNRGGAVKGGPVYRGPLLIDSCLFQDNKAVQGAAIRADTSDITIINSIFDNNEVVTGAGGYGGAIYAWRNTNTNPRPEIHIINSLFLNNKTSYFGTAIAIRSYDLTIDNSILWAGEYTGSLSGPQFNGRPIQYTSNQFHYQEIISINNSIMDFLSWYQDKPNITLVNVSDIEPFVNPNHTLAPESPAIDAGDNNKSATDLDYFGNNRIFNGTIDIGPHEFGAGVLGDFNGDGIVNIQDLFLLLSNWGSFDWQFDLNNDGIVNFEDLIILLNQF